MKSLMMVTNFVDFRDPSEKLLGRQRMASEITFKGFSKKIFLNSASCHVAQARPYIDEGFARKAPDQSTAADRSVRLLTP